MKNVFRIIVVALFMILVSQNLFAEEKTGVQFDSNANLGFIRYGENFAYAWGASAGFEHDDDKAKTAQFELGVFARKNFKIEDKTYLGLGITTGFKFGERKGRDISSSWQAGPYLIIDHFLSKKFVLNAGSTIVTVKQEKLEAVAGSNPDKVTSVDYFSPFFSLTYLF